MQALFSLPISGMSSVEPQVITVKFKVLGTSEVNEISVPENLESGALLSLAEGFSPSREFKVVFKGRVIKPGTTVKDLSIQNGDLLMISAKKGTKPAQNEEPDVPEVNNVNGRIRDRMQCMVDLINLKIKLAETENTLARINAPLYEADAGDVNNNISRANALATEVEQGIFALMSREAEPDRIFTAEESEAMERIRPTLEEYANSHSLADVYRASDLHRDLMDTSL